MVIDERLKYIINTLEKLGFQVLIVGGAVRNYLLNLEVNDYDLTTNASIDQIAKVFLKSEIIYRKKTPWAIKVNYKNFKVEISSFRIEREYQDRIPEIMQSVDNFKADTLRRDFTINAIGYSLDKGLVDYVDGIKDLNNKVVRTIRKPQTRFIEDPMRILRGLRLASTLNFTIETSTLSSIKQMYRLALNVDSDSVSKELRKILAGSNFDYVYKHCPELFLDISDNQFKNIRVKNRSCLLKEDCLFVYLKYLLKIETQNGIFKALGINLNSKFNTAKYHDLIKTLIDKVDYKNFVYTFIDYGSDNVDYLVKILKQLEMLQPENLKLYKLIKKAGYLKINELAISASDIKAQLGIREKYQLLEKLQKEIIANNLENTSMALLKRVEDLTTA